MYVQFSASSLVASVVNPNVMHPFSFAHHIASNVERLFPDSDIPITRQFFSTQDPANSIGKGE